MDRLALIDAFRLGCSVSGACGGAGISVAKFNELMRKGESDLIDGIDSPELELFLDVERAKQEFEVGNLDIIKRNAVDDWRAAAWLLERRRAKDYAARQDIDVNALEPIKIVMDIKPDSEA